MRLPLDLEPQDTLIVTHKQAKCHSCWHQDSSKADREGQQVGSGPIPGSPIPSPKVANIRLYKTLNL